MGLFLIWGNVVNFWALTYRDGPSGSEQMFQPQVEHANSWFDQHQAAAAAMGLGLIIVLACLLMMYFYSRAGLIIAIRNLLDKKPAEFKRSVATSRPFVSRIFVVWLILSCLLIVSAAVLFAPVGYLVAAGFGARAIILAAMATFIFIPIVWILGFVNIFSTPFVVLHDLNAGDSMRTAFELTARFWWQLLVVSFVMVCVTIIGFFASIFAAALALSPFVLLSGMPYDIGGYSMANGYVAIGFALALAVFFWMQAVIATFQHTCWILVFLEIVRPKKIEEESEAEVVPEVV